MKQLNHANYESNDLYLSLFQKKYNSRTRLTKLKVAINMADPNSPLGDQHLVGYLQAFSLPSTFCNGNGQQQTTLSLPENWR